MSKTLIAKVNFKADHITVVAGEPFAVDNNGHVELTDERKKQGLNRGHLEASLSLGRLVPAPNEQGKGKAPDNAPPPPPPASTPPAPNEQGKGKKK